MKPETYSFSYLGQEALGGLSAGIFGTVIGFPLDLIKTRMQTAATTTATTTTTTTKRSPTIFRVGRNIVRTEGIAALYKGIGPPLISLSILNTITFTQYTFFREVYQANPGWDYRNYMAGITCSPVSGLVSTIENFVKTQMQLDNITNKQFHGSFHCVRTLTNRHGPMILYTGHVVNTIREATFLGTYFFVYEGLRETLIQQSILHVQMAVPVAGGLSGALSWFISFPLDCVRAGVQGQQTLPPVKNARQVFQELLQTRGIRGLYAGASASIMRAFLVSGSRFSAYEFALFLLRGGRHYEKHH